MKPAAYSHTDTPEIEAIQIFESLVNVRRVKAFINRRDKIPNVDGHIELVDDNQTPLGKLDVQVRKIKDGSTSATCQSELIAYSKVNGLPLIYVGVDVPNRKAYWKHISDPMAELGKEKQSCTIRFDPIYDAIAESSPYLERWIAIAQDFQERISDYPLLRENFSKSVKLTTIPKADRIWFQKFIEVLNQYLDTDYALIKSLFFVDTWKLGAAITSAAEDSVAYLLYKIPKGENAPLLVSLPVNANALFSGKFKPKPIETGGIPFSANFSRKDFNFNPEERAKSHIARYIEEIFARKLLRLSGELICKEYIFNFVDQFHHTLGLENRDEYSLAELQRGIYVFFPQWYSIAVERYIKVYGSLLTNLPFPPFFAIALSGIRPKSKDVEDQISSGVRPELLPIRESAEMNFNSLIQALEHLTQIGIKKVSRPYARWVLKGPKIWNGLDTKTLRNNVPLVFDNIHKEYLDLVTANQFNTQRLTHASSKIAQIHFADLSKWTESQSCPCVDYFTVDNSEELLPPVLFNDTTTIPTPSTSVDGWQLTHNRITSDVLAHGGFLATRFFRPCPLLNSCYAWLAEDLSEDFGRKFLFPDTL